MSQVQQLLTQAEGTLTHGDDDNPRLTAEVLLTHVLQKPRTWLYAWPEASVETALARQFLALIDERRTGIPVAYLTGMREFWSLPLQVTNKTLIPRPETEHLIDAILELGHSKDSLSLLDLGTGSGAIAIAVASERPYWEISATDSSAAALQVASDNASALVDNRVSFFQGDWFAALPEPRQWHIIVSNPPYVAANDHHLQQGDLRFEPKSALASGKEGLDDLHQIIQNAPAYLYDDGWLLVEHGMEQGTAVQDIFRISGFTKVSTRKDLQQHDRLTMGQK